MFHCFGSGLAVVLYQLVRREGRLGQSGLPHDYLAEFVGTFVLVFTVGLNIITESPATAWSATAALMCMVYSLGDVSGAHFNPAVTLAVCASGRDKCSSYKSFLYICIQLIAGIWASAAYAFFNIQSSSAKKVSPLGPGEHHTLLNASIGELLFTGLLAFVVLATATVAPPPSQKSRQNFYFALCIGACVVVGGTCLGNISGGELNPAVSAGIYCSSLIHSQWVKDFPVPDAWPALYFGATEMVGGVLAAILFRLTHAKEYSTDGSAATLTSKCVAEFAGTFYLVLTVGYCSLAASGPFTTLAIAMLLTVMVYSMGPCLEHT
jgi:aquaporin Z